MRSLVPSEVRAVMVSPSLTRYTVAMRVREVAAWARLREGRRVTPITRSAAAMGAATRSGLKDRSALMSPACAQSA
jgi:uncharacterized protein (DUF849 family)